MAFSWSYEYPSRYNYDNMIDYSLIPELPIEILVKIACTSVKTFRNMLALRPVVEFSRSNRDYIMSQLAYVVAARTYTEYFINGRMISGDKFSVLKWKSGTREWRRNNLTHRGDDLPAVEYANGTKGWYWEGKLHRDGDRPAIIGADGNNSWWQNGKQHRDSSDLPAVEYANGSKSWWRDGVRHRDDGPALIRADGTVEYWVNGVQIKDE